MSSSGSLQFALSGKLSYAREHYWEGGFDKSLNIGLDVPGLSVDIRGTRHQIKAHRLFIWCRYRAVDEKSPGFLSIRDALLAQKLADSPDALHAFIFGDVRPRPAKDDKPASLSLSCSWRDIRLADMPFPARNTITLRGQVDAVGNGLLACSYGYSTPSRNGGKPTWSRRVYGLVLGDDVPLERIPKPKSLVFAEGHVLGVDFEGKSRTWLYAHTVF